MRTTEVSEPGSFIRQRRIWCAKMIAQTWWITCTLKCCERSRSWLLLSASPTELLPSTADGRAIRRRQFRDQPLGRNPQTRSRYPCARQAGNKKPRGRWRPTAIPMPIQQHHIKPTVFRRHSRPNPSSISQVRSPSSRGRFSTTRTPRPSGTPCVRPRA